MADAPSHDMARRLASDSQWHIGIAEQADRAAVSELRREALSRSAQFTVLDARRLDWNLDDDQGVVIIVRDPQGMLQSTMRVSVFGHLDDLERAFEYSLDGMPVEMPALAMSRAATRPGAMSRGLMAWIRFYYLSVVRDLPIRSTAAMVFEGAPRLGSIERAGYGFFRPTRGWDTEVDAHTNALTIVLGCENFDRALEVARRAIDDDQRSRCFDLAALRNACKAMLERISVAPGVRGSR